MKLAFYGLASLVLVGLGSMMPFSRAQDVVRSTAGVPERAVYVDEGKLARLHPAWRALSEMEATLAEVDAASGGVSPHIGARRTSSARVEDAEPRVNRRELESEIRSDAVSALARQEAEMQSSLWLRAQTARENMLARADADLAPRVREIETSTAAMLTALDEKYAPDHLNSRIRAGALRAMTKSPAIDAGSAKLKLEKAEGELARVENACDSDKQRVVDVASARIAIMREEEIARIDRWLDGYQVSENQRIKNSLLAAEDRLCRDLGTNDYPVRLREVGPAPTGRGVALGANSIAADTGDARELRLTAAALRKQIGLDVERTISELGRQKGVRVFLRQDQDGLPDATKQFADMMRIGEWSATGPVLCLARGQ